MDNALCGGAGATLTGAALAAVKAAIFMGDPRHIPGLSYNVGTCQASGVRSSTYLNIFCILTYIYLVRSAPRRLPVPVRGQHPVVLRLLGPVLLQRQQRRDAPGLRERVRLRRAHVRPQQAQRRYLWRERARGPLELRRRQPPGEHRQQPTRTPGDAGEVGSVWRHWLVRIRPVD